MSYGQGVKLQYCPIQNCLKFFSVRTRKSAKNRNLLKEKNIQDRSMWNLTSWRFRKCRTYWACELLNGSYRPSKMDESEKTGPSPKIRGVKKKRHGHNFEFWALPRNQRGTNHIEPTLIPWQSSKLKIVAVSFFLTPPFLRIFSSIFTWLWQPITLV